MGDVKEIESQDEWQKCILDGGSSFVEFFATWCPHCQAMEPVIAELSDVIGSMDCELYRIDIDKLPKISSMFADGVPSYVVFKKGVPVRFEQGEKTLDELESIVRSSVDGGEVASAGL